jgi:integrase
MGEVIYFMLAEEFQRLKIGITTNISNRLGMVQNACPSPVKLLRTIPGDISLELRLHRKLRNFRCHGEWFQWNEQTRRLITQTLNEVWVPVRRQVDARPCGDPILEKFMKGCRPLTDAEVTACLAALEAKRFAVRDRALFLVGVNTGFRISELLSLRLADVWQNGRLSEEIAVARRHMKKKQEGRSVPFENPDARAALQAWICELTGAGHRMPDTVLFRSREGGNRPISREQAYRILKRACAACGLTGKLGTHTLRKTFARKMQELLGDDLLALQQAMGHKDIDSTTKYVQFNAPKLRDAFRKLR